MGLDYDDTHDEEYADWLRRRDRADEARRRDEALDDIFDRADEGAKDRQGLASDEDRVSETWSPESSMIEEFQDAIDRVGAEEFREQLGKALHDLLCNHDYSDTPYGGKPGGSNRYQRHADAVLAKLMPKTVSL